MEIQIETLAQVVKENTALAWCAIFVVSLLAALLGKLILRLISGRLRRITAKTTSIWDDIGLDIVDGLRWWVVFSWTLHIFSRSLEKPEFVRRLLTIGVVVFTTFQVALWGLYIIRNLRTNVFEKRLATDPSSSAAIGLFYNIARMTFLTLVVLIAMSNLGVDITALVTGLGVGGIAVALAAQNVLGDLLASLSIVLDKPFVVGDFIIAGSEKGTVEQIGIKTTRLRSLSGEEIILSNKDLLESRIQNFKRMWQRRVVQKFGVVYSTPAENLEQIPSWVKQFIEKQKLLKFDRCHFSGFGDSSLDFEFVFYVLDPDYNVFMDLQQGVLLDIFKLFHEKNVDFAFPTRTVHIENYNPNSHFLFNSAL